MSNSYITSTQRISVAKKTCWETMPPQSHFLMCSITIFSLLQPELSILYVLQVLITLIQYFGFIWCIWLIHTKCTFFFNSKFHNFFFQMPLTFSSSTIASSILFEAGAHFVGYTKWAPTQLNWHFSAKHNNRLNVVFFKNVCNEFSTLKTFNKLVHLKWLILQCNFFLCNV